MLLLRHRQQSPRLQRPVATAIGAVHLGMISPQVGWDRAPTTAANEDVSPQPSPNHRPDHEESAPFTIPRDETKMTLSTFPSDVVVIVCGSSAPISHPPRYDDCLVTTSNDSILRTLLPPRAGELLLLLQFVMLLLFDDRENTSTNKTRPTLTSTKTTGVVASKAKAASMARVRAPIRLCQSSTSSSSSSAAADEEMEGVEWREREGGLVRRRRDRRIRPIVPNDDAGRRRRRTAVGFVVEEARSSSSRPPPPSRTTATCPPPRFIILESGNR